MRSLLLGTAMIAVAGALSVGAILDHRNKQARINRAEVAEWYCVHVGTRCGGASSARIETHWNERQAAYEVTVAILGAAGVFIVGSAAFAAMRRAEAA